MARELGYVPNRAAQALRCSSRDSVAGSPPASNYYYLNLMSGIQQILQPSQWTVVLGDIAVNGIYDRAQEDRMINRLIESRMAGIISTVTLQPESLTLAGEMGYPGRVLLIPALRRAQLSQRHDRQLPCQPAGWKPSGAVRL